MKHILVYLSLSSVLLLWGCKEKTDATSPPTSVVTEVSANTVVLITTNQLKEALGEQELQFVDVRTPEEFEEAHIQGAQNITYLSDDWQENINKLDTSEPIYIYCRSGRRSAKSAQLLKAAGFEQIFELEGGILNWQKEGMAVIVKETDE